MNRTRTPRATRWRTTVAGVGLAALALTAACGDDGDDAASGDTTEADGGTQPTEAPATDGGGLSSEHDAHGQPVQVNAVDYAFEDLPETVPAGTTLAMHNESEQELHELVAFRLPDDERRSPEDLVNLAPEDQAALFGGEPAAVLIAPPGEDATPVVGDGTLTESGRYLVLCAIPTGADPAAYMDAAQTSDGPPSVEGGAPHFVSGMVGEVTVEA